MSRGKASGYRLDREDVAIVLGMQARGDRDHDIAAWFGVNQGRVAEAKEGKFGWVGPAPVDQLPPKGAPGVKGKQLRDAVGRALEQLEQDGVDGMGMAILRRALASYDRNEA
jgi:hypothetical protein